LSYDAPPAEPEAVRLIPARRGFSVEYRGRALLSRVDPLRQAERLVSALLPAAERTLYVCLSPLFGYGLAALLQNLPPSSALLCIEAEDDLFQWTERYLDNALRSSARFHFARAHNAAALCRSVRQKWGARSFRRVETVKLSGGCTLSPELYENLIESLRGVFTRDWENAMTLSRLGRLYIRHFFRNLALLPESAGFRGLGLAGKPVLVAGAGPSLDPLLDTLQRKNVEPHIIAVDTAFSALRARGFRPRLTVALESQHWNLGDFTGWGGEALPLAMDLSSLPAHAAFAGGRPSFFWTPWTELRLFSRLKAAGLAPPLVPPLGSVGLCAVFLALRVSGSPVIVSGLDFSYTLDNYHTRESPSHRAALRTASRLRSLYQGEAVFRATGVRETAKSGMAVRSDAALRRYRALFAAEFGPAGGKRLFDVEGSGLPLGIPALSREEAAALLSGGASAQTAQGLSAEWAAQAPSKVAVRAFLDRERALLLEVRAILTGARVVPQAELEALIDAADYLWAHFPDCAGAGGRRPGAEDSGFLKRLRVEIDPFIALLEETAD
jgi:hypothetical protein